MSKHWNKCPVIQAKEGIISKDNQEKITDFVGHNRGGSTLGKSWKDYISFGKEKIKEWNLFAMKWLVANALPFTSVEPVEFREMIGFANKSIEVVSADTVKRYAIDTFNKCKNVLIEVLKDAFGRPSVTLDGWTSKNNKSFLGVTIHFIDKNTKLRSYFLAMQPLVGVHTAVKLAEAILNVCLIELTVLTFPRFLKLMVWLENALVSHMTTPKICQMQLLLN